MHHWKLNTLGRKSQLQYCWNPGKIYFLIKGTEGPKGVYFTFNWICFLKLHSSSANRPARPAKYHPASREIIYYLHDPSHSPGNLLQTGHTEAIQVGVGKISQRIARLNI
jgi:hypothetical protein